MIEVIMEISIYLLVAILVGFIFGWLISKVSLKNKYLKEVEKFKSLYLKEEKAEEKDKYLYSDKGNFIKTKDEIIEKLTFKLSLAEEKIMALKKEHEQEISAFLFERTDITQKYKELLKKIEEIKQSQRA